MENPEKPQEKAKPLTPFDLALAAKRGKLEVSQLRGAAKQLYKNFSEEQLKEYARAPEPAQEKSFGRQSMRRGARSF